MLYQLLQRLSKKFVFDAVFGRDALPVLNVEFEKRGFCGFERHELVGSQRIGSIFNSRVVTYDEDVVNIIGQSADLVNEFKAVEGVKFLIFNGVGLRKLKFDCHNFGSLAGTHSGTVHNQLRIEFKLAESFALNGGLREPDGTQRSG